MRFWFSKKKQPIVCNVQEKCVVETCEPDGTKYWRDKAFTLQRSNEGYRKQFLRMKKHMKTPVLSIILEIYVMPRN